ncbi:MAG: maleylpyruvate isomerase family mycothiol-dependent enzyme [Myxococcales bacterium]
MDWFDRIAEERRALADLISGLSEEQLRTPSLVPTWTVRDVAAHLVLSVDSSIGAFIWAALKYRSLEKAVDNLTWERAKQPVPELVELLRRKATNRMTPPGAGSEAPLTEVVVHGLDLRRPLGLRRELGEDVLRTVLGVLFDTPARAYLKRHWRDGLRYEATDFAWSRGEGPVLKGPAESLILAVTGRVPALADLTGDGVAVLRQRYAKA